MKFGGPGLIRQWLAVVVHVICSSFKIIKRRVSQRTLQEIILHRPRRNFIAMAENRDAILADFQVTADRLAPSTFAQRKMDLLGYGCYM